MKVLFINSVYGRGSTGRIVEQLGKALENQGDSYMVAYGRGEKLNDPHCYYIGSSPDVYVHAGLSRITDRAGFYSKTVTRKLLDFIRSYKPDVIHLHNLHGYYLNIEILFLFLKQEYKGRVIWTLHDCWAFTGHCVHFTYADCDKWKTGCKKCPQKKEYPASWLVDNTQKNYADKRSLFCGVPNLTVITVSQWLKRVAEQSFLKEYPIHCVYNGIDTKLFRPIENNLKHELGIEDKKMILLVSDGWNNRKGYDRVLAVAKKSPDDWHYVMIGLSSRQIKRLPENITGLERIWSQEKLIEYYCAADIFFNPSVEETFGLVTAEALSCGTPAVVMDSTACPELITRPANGTILPVNAQVEEYIQAINAGHFLPETNWEKDRFSIEKFIEGYMKVFCSAGE